MSYRPKRDELKDEVNKLALGIERLDKKFWKWLAGSLGALFVGMMTAGFGVALNYLLK